MDSPQLLPDEVLVTAAAEGNKDKCFGLVQLGADPDYRKGEGLGVTSPILEASKNGHVEVIQLLVECSVSLDTVNQIGTTPFMIAAEHGQLEVTNCIDRWARLICNT